MLDNFDTLYVWNGPEANRMEMAKAADIAARIQKKDRQGRAKVVYVNDTPALATEFWNLLLKNEDGVAHPSLNKDPKHAYNHLIASSRDGGDDEGDRISG